MFCRITTFNMKNFFTHLFLPKISNNYRPSLLHHRVLFLLILFFLSSGILLHTIKASFPRVLGISSDVSNQQLLLLTNEKRQENGDSALTISDQLSQAAANKATDMFAKNYWAHNAPDGTTPWVFIKSSGYDYIYAGENLARGFTTSSDVITAWMNSPEHKQNMLSQNYKDVGFAVATGTLNGEETVLVVEMLGSTNFAPPPVAKTVQQTTQIAVAISATPTQAQSAPFNNNSLNITPNPTNPSQNTTENIVTNPENKTLGIKSNVKNKTDISQYNSVQSRSLVDSAAFSSFSAKTIIMLFIFILILDMVLIERKKIVRFVGHNLDHVLFLSLILIIVIILAKGVIL